MKRLFAVILAVLLLAGCSAAEKNGASPEENNCLVIGTGLPESVYGPLVREFEARTGIWTLVQECDAAELLANAREGTDSWDLLLGCSAELLAENEDLFAPYGGALPREIPEASLCPDNLWVPFTSRRVVLIYNPMLVRRNPPTGFGSLLDPAWKGKIAFADPRVSPSAYTELVTLTLALEGDDVLSAFRGNLDRELPAHGSDVVRLVADGTYYIGLALEEDAMQAEKQGYDIAVVYPEEGTCEVPDGIAVRMGCEHPENAALFVSFALSADAQEALPLQCSRIPVRENAGNGERDFTLLPYDIRDAASRREQLLQGWEAAA